MPHLKQHITDLAVICREKGINRVVISPGSRNAPLIKAFFDVFGEDCVSIVDERSAAYFALGIAVYAQNPVALICTSGTAVLNYSPALAEAYYQQVPLLAVTADRPREWVDQQENQTLHQTGIYKNYIKGSYELPQLIASDDDLWHAHRIINEAVDLCIFPGKGPVHINVPLTEPLYDELPPPSETIRVIHREQPEITLRLSEELVNEWDEAQRIIILHGQDIPNSETSAILSVLAGDDRVIILAENISNVAGENIISNSNLVLSGSRNNSPEYPNLIIHSGGQVVSKALTGYLRKAPRTACWRIGTDKVLIDTFKQTTRFIPYSPSTVYRALATLTKQQSSTAYAENWHRAKTSVQEKVEEMIPQFPFSDFLVFKYILQTIPAGTQLSLGNSSIIRYSQLFPANNRLSYYSNRGVSGIDGCLSTAAGIAFASKKLTLALTGDLGFVYDSNALWNRDLPSNLKIIVINNGGGGIFHILKGPSEHPGFKNYIEANHPVNFHKLAEAFGLYYFYAGDMVTLKNQYDNFIKELEHAAILEIKTDAATSASVFRRLMSSPY